MPKTRTTYHHGDLKNAVLDAAQARMNTRAGAEFSVPELARGLGVTHGAVYKHFPTKKAIIVALAERALGTFLDFAQRELPPPSAGWDAHPHLTVVYVRFAVENPGLFRALFHRDLADLSDYPHLAQLRATQFQMMIDFFASVIRGGKKAVREAALAHWSMSHGLAVLLVDGQVPPEALEETRPGTLAKHLARLLETGIRR